jgi:PTS system nitrogen regulatory IIA component
MQDQLTLRDAAHLLHLSTQEVVKLAESGGLPGLKRSGKWEFNRRAVLDHVAAEIPTMPVDRLAGLERGLSGHGAVGSEAPAAELMVVPLLAREGIELTLPARTKGSVLAELVGIAERTELVWDRPALLEAVRRREDVCSTAVDGGIAIPHPRRTPEHSLGESLVVFARSPGGIHFGALDRRLTDLFFLVACTDEHIHLRVLARLCRLLRGPALPDALRSAESPDEVIELLTRAEEAELQAR